MIRVVIPISPGRGPVGLLRLVSLGIIGVTPGAIGLQLVAGSGAVAGHVPVADQVVAVAVVTVARELALVVVTIRRCLRTGAEGRLILRLARQLPGRVPGVI